jgi:hypothetical protein
MAAAATGCAAEAARILGILSRHEALDLGELRRHTGCRRRRAPATAVESERWELLEGIVESLSHDRRDAEVCVRLLRHIAGGGDRG